MRKMYAPYAICHVHDFNWTYHLRRPTPKPYNNNNRSNNFVDHTVETISCCPLDYSHSILLVRMVFIIVCWKAIEYQHCERITPLNGTDTTDFFCYFFLSEHHRRFFVSFLVFANEQRQNVNSIIEGNKWQRRKRHSVTAWSATWSLRFANAVTESLRWYFVVDQLTNYNTS